MSKKITIPVPDGKRAEWINGVLTLVDEQKVDNRPVTERIKTFTDACNALGDEHPFVTQYRLTAAAYKGDPMTEDFIAYLKLRIIVAVLNEGWEPKFTEDESRYFPWFYLFTKEQYDELDEEEKRRCVLRSGNNAYSYFGFVSSAMNFNAPIVLFGSEPFSTMVRMSNLKDYRYDWVWEKPEGANFQLAKYQPLKVHETISVFSRDTHIYNPQGLQRATIIKSNSNKGGRLGHVASEKKRDGYIQEWTNYPRSVLRFDYDPHRFHPTQKPVDLLRYLVLTYTNEGDTVLDNCSGSGTTAIACIKEKRHFIGFEKDETYWKKSVERVKNEQRQLSLF